MRKTLSFCTVLLTLSLLFSPHLFAQNPLLWKVLKNDDLRKIALKKKPAVFKVYQLDKAKALYFLKHTPVEISKDNILSLPDPEGNFHDFEVFETPVLPPALQTQYPDIRTYTAVAVNDENTTAKITMSTLGINVVVYSLDATYFMTPANDTDDVHYLVFNKKDYPNGFAPIRCRANDEADIVGGQIQLEQTKGGTKLKTNGENRRKFRCAVACTGEWANDVMTNPNVTDILSFITTVINGANGVFERELSVTLELVPQETSLIYLDPATDPYSGNNMALVSENQNNLDALLTSSGYDIGHLLANNGEGLAVTGSICDEDYKGTAISESLWPSDFGEVIHEMGHQMGSKHTFNSNQNFCSNVGYAPSAYEPGSGSTIMAYPMVCGIDNVLYANTDYYHVYSLDNITTLINDPAIITCGNVLPGAASAVEIDTASQEFYIPLNTPFELTAPEAQFADPNAGINYCWEQWDLGNFGGFEFNAPTWTEGPSFQSFDPTTNRTRSFPKIDYLVDSQYMVIGERLSIVPRDLHFRLTARSLNDGWGTYNSNKKVTVHVADLGPFRVTAPNDGALWTVGATETVSWHPGGSTMSPVNANTVDVYLSPDGGKTFPYLIGSNIPNTGSYNFQVIDIYSDSVIIKVKGSGNIFFDVSKSFNKIHGNPASVLENPIDKALIVFPNPVKDVLMIETQRPNEMFNYDITDVWGNRRQSGSFRGMTNINVSQFYDGVYFLRLINKWGYILTKKFVKTK